MKSMCFQWEEFILISTLPANAKYLALYLRTFMNNKQDMAWPSLTRLVSETGLTKPTVLKYLNILEDAQFLIKTKTVGMTLGGEQSHNNYIANIPEKAVKELYHLEDEGGKAALPGVVKDVYYLDTKGGKARLPKGVKELYPNNNSNNNNNIYTKFQKPTPEEIKQYCLERHNDIDPNQFFDFYESKGWKVGDAPMRNWQAAVRTWERNSVKPKETSAYVDYM